MRSILKTNSFRVCGTALSWYKFKYVAIQLWKVSPSLISTKQIDTSTKVRMSSGATYQFWGTSLKKTQDGTWTYVYSHLQHQNSYHKIISLNCIYGRNQSGCKKAKKVGLLPFVLWLFLTIFIFVDLMKITMCFKQLEASNGIADTKAQLSDFKLSKKLL